MKSFWQGVAIYEVLVVHIWVRIAGYSFVGGVVLVALNSISIAELRIPHL